MTVVPLKVALGLEKNYFWAFQKNNHGHSLDTHHSCSVPIELESEMDCIFAIQQSHICISKKTGLHEHIYIYIKYG